MPNHTSNRRSIDEYIKVTIVTLSVTNRYPMYGGALLRRAPPNRVSSITTQSPTTPATAGGVV